MHKFKTKYRELHLGDYRKKLALNEIVTTDLKNRGLSEFLMPYDEEEKQNMFDKKKFTAFGAFSKDELIGALSMGTNPKQIEHILSKMGMGLKNKKVCKMERGIILPNKQGEKIFPAIYNLAEEHAIANGFKHAVGIIHPDNKRSIKAMTNEGYDIVATTYINNFLRHIVYKELQTE